MIPEFLRRENVIENNSELMKALRKYKERFQESISLDWLQISDEEWVDVLNECVRIGKTFEEVFGKIEYEDDVDY